MVLYYLPVAGGLLEVTGNYAPKGGGEARRFVMGLSDGDAVSFAMPGYPQATYRFGRVGATVAAAVAVSGPSRLAEGRPDRAVFVACLATAANTCTERSLLRLPAAGLTGCMTTSQAQLALWGDVHPGYRVVRWSCRRAGASDLDA